MKRSIIMMDEWGPGYHSGFGAGGALMMGLFWVLVVVGIAVLVMYISKNNRSHNRPDQQATSLDILKTRYAKGEIDKAEYEQKRKDLKD